MSQLPGKLFFRIGEVAGLVGVEPHVLRYWEREFRSIRPTKSAKGQRVYSRKDVENLLRVRDLLYRDGFTIAGAKKKLQRPQDEDEDEVDDATASTSFADAEPIAAEAVVETTALDEGRERAASPASGTAAVEWTGVSRIASSTAASSPDRATSAVNGEVRHAHVDTRGHAEPARAEAPDPGAPASANVLRTDVREKLLALRSEVEAFLDELSP